MQSVRLPSFLRFGDMAIEARERRRCIETSYRGKCRQPFRRNYVSLIGSLSAALSKPDVNPFVNTLRG